MIRKIIMSFNNVFVFAVGTTNMSTHPLDDGHFLGRVCGIFPQPVIEWTPQVNTTVVSQIMTQSVDGYFHIVSKINHKGSTSKALMLAIGGGQIKDTSWSTCDERRKLS